MGGAGGSDAPSGAGGRGLRPLLALATLAPRIGPAALTHRTQKTAQRIEESVKETERSFDARSHVIVAPALENTYSIFNGLHSSPHANRQHHAQ